MATDSSSGTLPSSSRLTIDSSSSIARSKESFLTSTCVFSPIDLLPGTLTGYAHWVRLLGKPGALLLNRHGDGLWRAQGLDEVPINAVTWAATDSLRPCRSYPPSSTETIRPPALAAAASISLSVAQLKSSAFRLREARGSR